MFLQRTFMFNQRVFISSQRTYMFSIKNTDSAVQSLNCLPWQKWSKRMLRTLFTLDIMTNDRDQWFFHKTLRISYSNVKFNDFLYTSLCKSVYCIKCFSDKSSFTMIRFVKKPHIFCTMISFISNLINKKRMKFYA